MDADIVVEMYDHTNFEEDKYDPKFSLAGLRVWQVLKFIRQVRRTSRHHFSYN